VIHKAFFNPNFITFTVMFLKSDNKGLNDTPRYLITFGCVIASFAIIGYLPISLLIGDLTDKGIELKQIEDLQYYIGLNSFFIYLLMPFIIGFFTLLACVKYIHKRNVLSVFTNRESFDWKRFFFSFSIWGGVMLLFFVISYLAGYPIYWNYEPSSFFFLVLISIFILPIQTTFEEVFFRGYLFQGLDTIFKKRIISVLITGALFGLMHGSNPEVEKIGMILLVFYILNGIFLGLIVLMDDGLELSMGYHTINNIFAAIVVTNDWQAFHTDALFIDKSAPEFGIENILTLLVIQPLLLYIFSKKYKWSNWKQKLFN